jgi:hypothetical protein
VGDGSVALRSSGFLSRMSWERGEVGRSAGGGLAVSGGGPGAGAISALVSLST